MAIEFETTRETGHGKWQKFPDLAGQAYEDLKASIAQHGVLNPVELDEEGDIIDGHQRMRAWIDLGKNPEEIPTTVRHYETEQERWKRVFLSNLHRRNLTAEQKKEIIVEYLAKFPDAGVRQVARETNSSHHTVRDVIKKSGKKTSVKADAPQGLTTAQVEMQQKVEQFLTDFFTNSPGATTKTALKAVEDAGLQTNEHKVRQIKKTVAPVAVTAKPETAAEKKIREQQERDKAKQLAEIEKGKLEAKIDRQTQKFYNFFEGLLPEARARIISDLSKNWSAKTGEPKEAPAPKSDAA